MRIIALLLLLTSFAACAEPLKRQSPSKAGFDAAQFDRLDAFMQQIVADGTRAGLTWAVGRGDRLVHVASSGFADVASGRVMTPDTPVRIASMTKPITSVAVMMLVESGKLSLDTRLESLIPAFKGQRVATEWSVHSDGKFNTEAIRRPITIQHLLTHTSGLGYIFDGGSDLGKVWSDAGFFDAEEGTLADRVEKLATLPLYFQPGERWFYSFSTSVLGRVVEIVSGMAFDDFVKERITEPLEMTRTQFGTDGVPVDAATIYTENQDGDYVPVDAGLVASLDSFPVGGAGLFSTLNDYARFCAMILNGGMLDGVRILRPATVARMLMPSTPIDADVPLRAGGTDFGLGFDIVVDPGRFPAVVERGHAGWGGYFNTLFWLNPETKLFAIFMSQEQPSDARPIFSAGMRMPFVSLVTSASR